jgi:hypothetical protein
MLGGAPLPKELTFDIYLNGVLTESAGIGADGKSFPQDHLMDGLQKPGVLDIEFRTKQIVQPTSTSGVVVQTFGSGHGKLTVMKAATTVKNFWARAELHPAIVGEKPYIYMGGNIERITDNKDKAAPGLPIRIKVNGMFANTATTTPDGSFVATFELPAHPAGKAYLVEALVDGNDLYLPTASQTVSVVLP